MPTPEAALIRSSLLQSVGITAVFTERQGGISATPFDSFNLADDIGDNSSAVSTNMERLVHHAGLASPPHQARQIHATDHLLCSGPGAIHDAHADILITSETACPIAARTADCLPLLLADPIAGVVAAVHAGWRGTAQRIAARAVDLLKEHGCRAENIYAALGPVIGPCCFEVDRDVAEQLAASTEGGTEAISHGEKPHADLATLNSMQLAEAGISSNHIEAHRLCTCCYPQRFFSYRRDHGKSGRHLAVVALPAGL